MELTRIIQETMQTLDSFIDEEESIRNGEGGVVVDLYNKFITLLKDNREELESFKEKKLQGKGDEDTDLSLLDDVIESMLNIEQPDNKERFEKVNAVQSALFWDNIEEFSQLLAHLKDKTIRRNKEHTDTEMQGGRE